MTRNYAQIHLSEIDVFPLKPNNGLMGFASFILNGQFYVGNIGLHSRPDGSIRLLYPNKLLPNGKIISSFHPITKDAGLEITQQITCKYNNLLNNLAHKPNKRGYVHEI